MNRSRGRSENLAIITRAINHILQKHHPLQLRRRGGLIISHAGFILTTWTPPGHVILDGGLPARDREMFETIRKAGYGHCPRRMAVDTGARS
jgi:hypothetical protein